MGRSAELAFISAFLGRAAEAGAALLLSGEPGVGKSLLLDCAADMAAASGAVVLRGQGIQFEAEIGFSALNQLLLPLMPHLPRLEEAHRTALSGMSGQALPAGHARRPAPTATDAFKANSALIGTVWTRPLLAG